MKQPEGFEDSSKPTHICKLIKAIYGLKQAPRAWFDRLRAALLEWGFKNTKSDTSLFFLKTKSQVTFLLIYVDDIIVTGSDINFLQLFTQKLNESFALKDLGDLHYFLGVEVYRDESGMYLNQAKYITDLLQKFDMSEASSYPSPMTIGKIITASTGEPMKNATLFRYAIGALQYLTNTGPDISFTINKLSQYLSAPSLLH